ncbi:hypothetical protein BMS3Bbin12_02006 [bacterium BMS3Bbin12]|nr:hypothetical protein BMS3Bbin12_02006 [bacterium BMS3Bbin12]GBE49720.1 hypothetical protein BMS3Bbin13_00642 [bacterium BMS3Bbin13]
MIPSLARREHPRRAFWRSCPWISLRCIQATYATYADGGLDAGRRPKSGDHGAERKPVPGLRFAPSRPHMPMVAWMQAEGRNPGIAVPGETSSPDCASLHPGYRCRWWPGYRPQAEIRGSRRREKSRPRIALRSIQATYADGSLDAGRRPKSGNHGAGRNLVPGLRFAPSRLHMPMVAWMQAAGRNPGITAPGETSPPDCASLHPGHRCRW